MKNWIKTFICFLGISLIPTHVHAELRVHFLGTGGPEITKDRFGVATLIEVPGRKYLFDAGRGVLQRLGESRINLPDVRRVLFTHLHSDHIEGLPALWMTAWFITKREDAMFFYGPPGTKVAIDGMRQFLSHDVIARVNPIVKASGIETNVEEIVGGGVIKDGPVLITAIKAEHGDGNPALGYLFEYKDRSILLTGDSSYTPTFGEAVKSVDVTICNVYAPSLSLMQNLDNYEEPVPTVVRAVSKKLATPEDAAAMFRETKAKVGIFTHNIFYDSSEADIVERVNRAGYHGRIHIAKDRDILTLGEDILFHEPPPIPDDLEINSLNFKDILGPN